MSNEGSPFPENVVAREQRAAAFRLEHDPLAFRMMRGEPNPADGQPITQATLQAVAASIRAQFPYQ